MSEWNTQEFLKSHVAMGEDVESSRFPELSTLSPAFFYQFVPVAKAPEKPEVVFIPRSLGTDLELTGMLAVFTRVVPVCSCWILSARCSPTRAIFEACHDSACLIERCACRAFFLL